YRVEVRLPYEAEWEYAARAGTTTKYYWGNKPDGRYMWNHMNSGNGTHPVGKRLPNKFGLYDMFGNVMEWCHDWYDVKYYSNSPEKNPVCTNDGSDKHVIRGGSWQPDYGNDYRSACRGSNFYPNDFGCSKNLGFRIVVVDR
ncbi:formylglycine-generating enzyme family protein, partial [Spirochaetota bacterium]